MGKIIVHAGDFIKGKDNSFWFGTFTLKSDVRQWVGETIRSDELLSVELASEETVKKMGSAAAWGAVGALALGPVGLLAGVLAGGNKKEVTFIAEFKDGRRMLATTDSNTFTQIKAAMFTPGVRAASPAEALKEVAETPSILTEAEEAAEPAVSNRWDHLKPVFQALIVLAISLGFISAVVVMSHRSAESVPKQPTMSAEDSILNAISNSDDFAIHKDAFVRGAKALLDKGSCSLSALKDVGGWVRSVGDPSGQTYFTYCGAPNIGNRWYITLPSGRIYQNPY